MSQVEPIKSRRAFRRIQLPVRSVLTLILLLVAVILLVVDLITGVGLRAAAGIRAYVGGEGLWSKAEKDATYLLAMYAVTGDRADYDRFLAALSVPQGDREARLELEKPEPKKPIVVAGLLAGRNHVDDVDDMIWIFRSFRHVSYLERAIKIWEEGDVWIARLRAVGGDLHKELEAGPLDEAKRQLYLRRIAEINRHVTTLEDDFSFTLGEAARWLRALTMRLVVGMSVVLLVVAAAAAYRIAGVLQRGEDAVHAALENAEAANRTKSTFLGLVSHELRTPLTVLQLQIERLKLGSDAALTPRQSEILGRMLDASRRLTDMVAALLQYVRVESGGLQLALTSVELGPLVAETTEEMRVLAQKKGLSLRVEAAPGMPPLVTDPRLLRYVLTNLVGNAIKFTRAGSIDISLGHERGEHRIRVTDTGPGIAAEDQARVFQPFEQLETIREKHVHGIGLGLSLVREITRALGGRVELTSVVGRGSTFVVSLPPLAMEESAESPAA